ncbi:MAG: MFS transporter [Promethearchaeota archaeon]
MSEEKVEKLDYKLTFFIGLAFFTTAITWSLYNTQVNQKLNFYLGSLGLVGIFMALDNLVGVIIQPIMGGVSDNTRTRFGRRIPYLIIGIPSAALFFAFIPFEDSLGILLLWMFLFVICMAFYRSQAVALMPDFVKPANRSKANAVINLMGGIGSVVAFTLSGLSDIIGLQVVFIMVSIIMIVALGVLLLTVKEQESFSYKLLLEREEKEGKKIKETKDKIGLIASIKDILAEKDKSTLFMLLAILFWFIGYQGAEALLSIYGVSILGLTSGMAGFMFNFVALPFIIFAIPGGILATKIGRRLTIKIGLVMMIVSLFIAFLAQTNIIIVFIMLVFMGIGWAFVNINSIVIIWEMAPSAKKIGTYTGVYYFFSFLAAIVGPGLVGGLTDLTGEPALLLNCVWFFILALIMMFFVKRGEAGLSKEERAKAIQEL